MNNYHLLTLIISVCMLFSACSSEIDKCVDAQVKAWEAKKMRINGESSRSTLWENLENLSLDKSKEEIASEARMQCLRVAGTGKKD